MRNSIYWLQYSCMWPIKLQPWTWALLSIQHKPPSSLASTTDILFQLVSLLLFLPTPLHPHTHSIPHIMLNPAARVILLKQKSNQVTGRWMVFNYPLDKIWITDEIPLILFPTSLSYSSSILALSFLSTPTLEGSSIQSSFVFSCPTKSSLRHNLLISI